MYVRRLTRALPATLILALFWPAVAYADPPNADLDHDKVTDNLEQTIANMPDDGEVSLIVSLERDATSGRIEALERAVGDLDVKERFGVIDAVAVTATKQQVRELAAEGVVDRVEEDLPVHSSDEPFLHASNDSAQSSFGVAGARLADPLLDGNLDDPDTYSADDLVAAVIDTGIDANHVDLNGGKVLAFKDFVNGQTDPYDDDGHGTHVAATLAGEGDGNPLYAGVAPAAGLVGVKVLDENGDGQTSDVVAGIEWAVEHKDEYGIEALNLSLGSTQVCSDGFGGDSDAVNAAWGAGLLVTVAAGNNGPGTCTIGSPGAAKDVITVGSMADLGANGFKQARSSSRGPTADGRIKPDITAPGVGITSAEANTVAAYTPKSGTSMATPFVTGVALLMMDANPSFDMDVVKDTIRATAVDWGRGRTIDLGDPDDPEDDTVLDDSPGSTGPDINYGAGRLDAYAALDAASGRIDTQTDPAPRVPQHTLREGVLSGTGQVLEYSVDVADTQFPIAATLIVPDPSSFPSPDPLCHGPQVNPDFDLQLIAPNGSVVATAAGCSRQDELGYRPTTIGVYRLRVRSARGAGDFFVDVSGGTVSRLGTSNPGEDKDDGATTAPTTPTTTPPSRPTPSTDAAAFAAVADAARRTARRAIRRMRAVGLRRLLKRGRFTFAGLTHGAGKVQVAVRMSHRGRKVTVARAVRRVSRAGKPRLKVKLTKAGRRLLGRKRSVRLTIRAAVTDSSSRRRYADRVARVRR